MAMSNAYLALGYACNEKCRCCPLVNKNGREKLIPLERLLKEVDQMEYYGVTDVTLSGGEPTLHPDIFSLIEYLHNKKMGVHILSNGERFSDTAFSDELIKLGRNGNLTITTTFHSERAEEHEYQNVSPGSFFRSLNGIQYLDRNGLKISVKHCITKNNYRNLPEYLRFVMESFSSRVEIQLWGIDLYGLEHKAAQENFVDFQEIRPYIQKAIDVFEESGRAEKQTLNLNNLPLCMCDCYYWRYFTIPQEDSYVDHNNGGKALEENSGPVSIRCKKCPFVGMCTGAYLSNFELLGNDIVSVPKLETIVNNIRCHYVFYTEQEVGKLMFSPYVIHRLRHNGYWMSNPLTGGEVLLRLRVEQILCLQKILTNGSSAEELIECLNRFELNGIEIMNDCIRKGIIE